MIVEFTGQKVLCATDLHVTTRSSVVLFVFREI